MTELADGESRLFGEHTLARRGTVLSCSCASWTAQHGTGLCFRTCTHLQQATGSDSENSRLLDALKSVAVVRSVAPSKREAERITRRSEKATKHPEPPLLLAQKWADSPIEGYCCFDAGITLHKSGTRVNNKGKSRVMQVLDDGET